MNSNTEFNFFIKIAEITMGIPNPNEYTKSNETPFKTVPETEAIIKADPKKAPIHGVKLIENITPNTNAEKIPTTFCFLALVPWNIFRFMNSR